MLLFVQEPLTLSLICIPGSPHNNSEELKSLWNGIRNQFRPLKSNCSLSLSLSFSVLYFFLCDDDDDGGEWLRRHHSSKYLLLPLLPRLSPLAPSTFSFAGVAWGDDDDFQGVG